MDMENESRQQRRTGEMLAQNSAAITLKHHGIDVTLAPTYDVHAGQQSVGKVWKEGKRFYAVPVHRQNQMYEQETLEGAIQKLFEDEGISHPETPQFALCPRCPHRLLDHGPGGCTRCTCRHEVEG